MTIFHCARSDAVMVGEAGLGFATAVSTGSLQRVEEESRQVAACRGIASQLSRQAAACRRIAAQLSRQAAVCRRMAALSVSAARFDQLWHKAALSVSPLVFDQFSRRDAP